MPKKVYDDNVKRWSNIEFDPNKGFKTEQPSLTVPGQSLTIEELLNRHSSGQPLTYSQHLQYQEDMGEEPIPIFQDLTDIDDMRAKQAEIKAKLHDHMVQQSKQVEKPVEELKIPQVAEESEKIFFDPKIHQLKDA